MGCFRSFSDKIPARHILCFMMFLGFMVTFLLRVNINLAVVGMVNSTDTASEDWDEEIVVNERASNNLKPNKTLDPLVLEIKKVPIGEFTWNELQQSIILSSFFWGYLFFQIPGGRVAEVWGTKTVFGTSVLANGFLTLALPVAARMHWGLLLIIRALQGLAQGVVFPCLSAAVAKWVPVNERARFISFSIQGCSLGQVVALPLCGWILTNWGWPAVFYISGILAIVWYFAWFFLVFDSPQEHPRLSIQEKQYLERTLEPRSLSDNAPPVPWIAVLTSFQFWVGVVAAVGNDWGFHTFCNFGPKYMKNALGFDLEQNIPDRYRSWSKSAMRKTWKSINITYLQSSWLSSLPFLSQYIFAIAYGAICDSLLKYGFTVIRVRKFSVIVSHVLPAFGMLGLSVTGCNVVLSVFILTFSVSAIGALSCGFFQNPLDIAPNYAGSLTGLTNAIGAVTAVISTPLAGAILQANGSPKGWHLIFVITAAVYMITSIPYLAFAKAKIEPWNYIENVRTRKKSFSLRQVSTGSGEPGEDEMLTPKKGNSY